MADQILHEIDSVDEAIDFALQLRTHGFDLFRGQLYGWAINASLNRPGVDFSRESVKLRRFVAWVENHPALHDLHGEEDKIIAVAQHYGIATPFLDATSDPQVAAYFASAALLSHNSSGSLGSIICWRSRDITDRKLPTNTFGIANPEQDRVRIVDVDVPNLWRLQAQSGKFLYMGFGSDELNSIAPMINIIFKHSRGTNLPANDYVYPLRRSPMEVTLESFFAREDVVEQLYPMVGSSEFVLGPNDAEVDVKNQLDSRVKHFIDRAWPADHHSWTVAAQSAWFRVQTIEYDAGASEQQFIVPIVPRTDTHRVYSVIRTNLESQMSSAGRSGGKVQLQIDVRDDEIEKSLMLQNAQTGVERIYDGMKFLPFTDSQIADAMSLYLTLCIFDSKAVFGRFCGDFVDIEFLGATSTVIGRSFVSTQGLREAMRDDLRTLLATESVGIFSDVAYWQLTDLIPYPRKLFKFEPLVELLSHQIIPSQMYLERGTGLAICNPYDIALLGLPSK